MADRERESGKGQDQTAESATGAGAAPGTMMGALVDRLGAAGARRVIQRRLAERREKAEPDSAEVQAAAESGVRGPAGSLPHQATIQKAFGKHDVSHVKAHVGGEAAKGAAAMGAEAFATGDHVGFAGAPSLHTAAHEAAHVIQQQAGVHLSGGVGQEGDRHEQHADAVAERVVEGRSAEGLLDQATGEEEEEWDEDEEEEGGAPPTASATTATTQAATTATVGHPGAAPASPPGKATQAKRRSGPAPTGVVQLARQPAVVTFGKGAGLHKSDRKKKLPNAPVKVRSGGVFGSGTKVKIPAGTQIVVDPQKPVTNAQYLYAEHGGKIGYVKSAKVAGEQIGASSYWALPDVTGAWQIWNDQSHQIVGQETFAAGQKNAVMQSLAHVMGTQTVVEDKDGLIKEVVHKCRMGNAPDPALWQQAAINIDQKIATRVQTDAAQLVAAGLITNQHHLRGVKFTGADFHKGGQAPFFLTFETNDAQNPDVRKVVYKPGNLGVDKQLFGSQQGSLARALDDQGTAISNYTILTRQDAAHHNEHYGYMKFVESGAPTNQAELLSVYQSLAANMAVSFLAGLEDIHHENVLLLRDRVQVIDMEATTGMFSKKQNQQGALDPGRGGFLAMQWNGALRGIKDKLLEAANSGALQSAPASGAAQAAMVTKFGQILGAAQQGGFDQSWQAQTQALGQLQSRLVPIATTDFYGLIPRAKAKATQQAWDQEVDDPNGALLNLVRGSTGHTDAFLKRVLKSPGTYHALFRGEVPYYVRDLGGAQVFDEEGNPFSSAGCSKVGQAMGTEMDSRRQELQQNGNHADVFAIFQAQIVPIVGPMNDAILQWIQAFAQRQNQGGGQQP